MADQRPCITASMTLSDFASWYWLRSELVRMCRVFGLSTTGNKVELEDRLRRRLSGSFRDEPVRRRTAGAMPRTFGPDTVIGVGWRCNPVLGAYFRTVVGKSFRFNAAMRDFIHHGASRTLAEAVVCFQASQRPEAPKTPIPRQLQYNQHFRDFFAVHPTATRQQAIAAWWEKRSKPHGTRSAETELDDRFA